MEKLNQLTSENIIETNIEKLKHLFPTVFKEGKVVMEELQAILGDYVEKEKEFYEFNWAGKTMARQEANKPSTGTLRPCKEESKNWDDTENLFIEGDNLEVLKLLQKTYSNRIKMIYIDPPYNTGKDFVYKDNYKDNLDNYLKLTGQADEEGKKLSANTESDGRYHSNWLNMMYPRLKLARNLLTEDGVIFISIDDNEQANLKKLCDEIFGEENFVANVTVITGANQAGEGVNFQKNTEFCLIYSRNMCELKINRIDKVDSSFRSLNDAPTPLSTRLDMGYTIYYNEFDNDFIPVFDYDKDKIYLNEESLVYQNDFDLINKNYIPIRPGKRNGKLHRWRWGIDTFKNRIKEVKVKKINNEYRVGFIQEGFNPPKNYLNFSGGTIELKEIMNDINTFDYPKSINFLKYLIGLGGNIQGYILDFFAGSGTTAHAVMALNAEDGGNRKCISVQLPEPTDEKSEAYKAGYKTIAEISKERIRRAGEKIKNELITNDKLERSENLDIGFRVFKLDSSNIKRWDTNPDALTNQLDVFENALKDDRTEEDVLYEILLKYGLDLTMPILEKEVDGCVVHNIGFGSLYVCLSEKISPNVAGAIAEWHQESDDSNPNVIFRDNGFKDDAAKTNAVQTLRQVSEREGVNFNVASI